MTDNGSCFVSEEFELFLQKNGIKHITSAPYHPATNGLAERAVQIVKRGLKKVKEGTIRARIAKVLYSYRITPQTTTGMSPAELLLGRRPKSRLDLLKPNMAVQVESKQQKQKAAHDKSAKLQVFQKGGEVYMRNHGPGQVWLPGKIEQVTGPLSFRVQLNDGQIRRCHQDHLKHRSIDPKSNLEQSREDIQFGGVPISTSSDSSPVAETPPESENETPHRSENETTHQSENETPPLLEETARASTVRTTAPVGTPTTSTARAYPRRARVPPERFEPKL